MGLVEIILQFINSESESVFHKVGRKLKPLRLVDPARGIIHVMPHEGKLRGLSLKHPGLIVNESVITYRNITGKRIIQGTQSYSAVINSLL